MNSSIKWLSIFLFCSIALNIFIGGYFIGNSINKPEGVANALDQDMKSVFKSLPLENRKQLGDMVKQQQLQILANQQKMRDIRLDIAKELVQEPLDKQKLGILFEKMAQYSSQNVSLAQQSIFQTFTQLSLQDRMKVAKVLIASASAQKQVTPRADKSS
ncbi:MAG: periplasmic heavy metal sensor [Gammaproteobacteria bacterium]|jgi:uncharacterized membrane protein|nr:periplasmic heavy metal sensor [Gammaproteobacteria bacterium]